MVLRPLSHIKGDWELFWGEENAEYKLDEDTFVALLNELITDPANTEPPDEYHKREIIWHSMLLKTGFGIS